MSSAEDFENSQQAQAEMAEVERYSAFKKFCAGAGGAALALACARNPSAVNIAESTSYISTHAHSINEWAAWFTTGFGLLGGISIGWGLVDLNRASGHAQMAAELEGALAHHVLAEGSSLDPGQHEVD